MKTAGRRRAVRRTHPGHRIKPKTRYVYGYSEFAQVERVARTRDAVKGLLGGKGANLAEMTRMGLPVPPGFVITTEGCRAFLQGGGKLPPALWNEVIGQLRLLEKKTGKRLGDPERPLLLSCRSGSKFSMPGMMDTVLNIGLNDEIVEAMAKLTGDRRFAMDAYRRLLQMFATVVLELSREPFEAALLKAREQSGVHNDADLSADQLAGLVREFKALIEQHAGRPFPADPIEQLRLASSAVFHSWNGKRAFDYRKAAGISHDLGTAVNIVTMVFGNMGSDSGTGVATTRNVTTGEAHLEGDFLINAQGEDVVAGTRPTLPVAEMAKLLPGAWKELERIAEVLEQHFREVQDIEFTIERGTLWMLQTRDAKRTAQAAIRIAVDLANEKRITREEAVLRVSPDHVDYFLHPQFEPKSRKAARESGAMIASGLNVSPGAAIGRIAFDADTAEEWAHHEKKKVLMIRPETRPDDVHGMLASEGVLTTRGGRTSHAALVARQFGKPAVVGAMSLQVDLEKRVLIAPGGRVFKEGDWMSIDGTTGEIFAGELKTMVPDVVDPYLLKLLGWADKIRRLGVWANADYPVDAERARNLGAEGIGLCRTEHMFFEADRLPIVQRMILATAEEDRNAALAELLPLQRKDFHGLFTAMSGLPVTIRLIDPPLHEFLPNHDALQKEVTELETRAELGDRDPAHKTRLIAQKRLLEAVERLREQNPMLGLRGVRLGIHMPGLIKMQVRAIFEAACDAAAEGATVKPKIMIPLAATAAELRIEKTVLEEVAKQVMKEKGHKVHYQFGTMIEIPRAALVADDLAEHAEFFSFGTNDLTQTTFGISRDDAETGFLLEYLEKGILKDNPFATIDPQGVGGLMKTATTLGRSRRPRLDVGICGEHGGDPASIKFCDEIGLNYVSCSPFRVPIARLAAAHAVLKNGK